MEELEKNENIEEEVFEKKKKRPIDKTKIITKIIALFMVFFMVFSVFGTLLFYLIQK